MTELAAQRLRFQEEIKKLAASQDRANAQLQIENAERKRTQEENEQLREQLAESGRASEYLRNQRNLLEGEVKRCGDEIAGLRQQLGKEAGQTGQVHAENERLRQAGVEFRQAQAAWETRSFQFQAQLKELARAREEAKAALEKEVAQRERSEAQVQQLRQEVSAAQRTQTQLDAQRAQLQAQWKELSLSQEKSEAELERVIAGRKRLQEELEQLRQKGSGARRAQEELESRHAQLQAQQADLAKTLEGSAAETSRGTVQEGAVRKTE